jgi:hypothetical protein
MRFLGATRPKKTPYLTRDSVSIFLDKVKVQILKYWLRVPGCFVADSPLNHDLCYLDPRAQGHLERLRGSQHGNASAFPERTDPYDADLRCIQSRG